MAAVLDVIEGDDVASGTYPADERTEARRGTLKDVSVIQ
jgi:hypothetical protein